MTTIERHTFLDPVHGSIRLTDTEREIVNHPLFRRLHHIRQNGLLYLVFPAASHSRFEHSIGVLHVASDIVDEVQANALIALEKSPPAICRPDAREAGKATGLEEQDYRELRRLVRLAGLVHDLGHGPYSHHFDAFAPRASAVKSIIESDLPEADYLLPALPASDVRVKHELMSCLLFAYLGREVGIPVQDGQAVAAIILKRPSFAAKGTKAPLLLASDIVASAPADADRMDYLLRDSRSIGVSYGLYDYNRLVKSFLPFLDPETGELRLGIKRSGIRAVENFVQARFELFVQVYYHKTNRAVQLMLKEVADAANREGISPFPWDDLSSLLATYLDLSDEQFLRALRGLVGTWPVDCAEINGLAERIHKRDLWKRVYEGPHVDTVQRTLRHKHPETDPLTDIIDPKATKGLEQGASVLVRQGDGAYQIKPGTTWVSESPVIEALQKYERGLKRVYIKRSDSGLAALCKEAAWDVTGEAT